MAVVCVLSRSPGGGPRLSWSLAVLGEFRFFGMRGEAFTNIRRWALWLLGSGLLGLPLTSGFLQGDGHAYYAVTEAVYSGEWPDLSGELYLKLVTHRAFFFDYVTERWVSPVSFGLALVQAPFLFIGDSVLGRVPAVRDYGWVLFGHVPIPWERTLALWLSGVVALAVFWAALDRLGWGESAGDVRPDVGCRVLFLIGGTVAAPVVPYALVMPAMPHAWEAAGAALWLLVFRRLASGVGGGGQADRWRWWTLGCLSGWLVSVRVINAAWVLGFILWRLRPRRGWRGALRRQAGSWVFWTWGLLPWALLVLAYNRLAYGAWLRTGYESGLFVWSLPAGAALQTYARHTVYYLFHPGHGLFVWSPVALLGVVGLLRRVWHRGWDDPAAGVLVVWLAFWLGLSTYRLWWGDFTVGPRFYVVMAPFLGYGLMGLLWPRPVGLWAGRVLYIGTALLVLYSGALYWVLSSWAARGYLPDSMHPVIPRITRVLEEVIQAVWGKPSRLRWAVEPALPWWRMAALTLDRASRSTADRVRLEWGDVFEYDALRSLLQMPLRLRVPVSLQEPGFILLQVFRGDSGGRPFHPRDWIAFLQLGPLPRLASMEAVTVDFLFRGVSVTPAAEPLVLHYRWNPQYLGPSFPDRLYVCGAYQGSSQTAFTLGCSTHRVVRRALGASPYRYGVLLQAPYESVWVEASGLLPVVLRVEVRTLRGRLVLEPDVRILTQPVEDLQAVLFLGHRLTYQAGPFRGPLVLTLWADRPVRVRHRADSSPEDLR